MKSITNNASKEAKSCYLRRYQNDHRNLLRSLDRPNFKNWTCCKTAETTRNIISK